MKFLLLHVIMIVVSQLREWKMNQRAKAVWGILLRGFVSSVLPVLVSGIVRAFAIYMFVTPNEFAPGGINGIAVLLFFVAFFLLGKRQAIISTASMLLTSGLLIVLDYIPHIEKIIYKPEYAFLAAIAGGILLGAALAVMLKCCGTSGGTTVLASLVNKKYRNISVSALTSAFDACVVLASFFVYNQGASFTVKLDPVLLALVSLFVTSKTCDAIMQGFKTAYKFEIVTNDPETLSNEIMQKPHHGVTRIAAEGMYSHEGRSVLVCLIRKRQIADLQKIIKSHPDTFAYFSSTSEVFGKFLK